MSFFFWKNSHESATQCDRVQKERPGKRIKEDAMGDKGSFSIMEGRTVGSRAAAGLTALKVEDGESSASLGVDNGNGNGGEKVGGDNGTLSENSSSGNAYDVFVKWLQDNGTLFPKLELKDYGNEVRGCHSTAEVEEDEMLVQVPLKCLITVEMGKETDIGKAVIASGVELDAPKHLFLMFFILTDRLNPSSFFKPYYDILPASLGNMPVFWKPHELALLEGSYLLTQIAERNEVIESDYNAICSIAPRLAQVCTLEEFKWARMCVCSRNFGLVVNGVRTAALVPYADMLNHYRPRETRWQFDDNVQGFTITSLQKISMGAQVYDSYGQKCNHRFLLNYGFSVENNVEPDGFCPNEVPILLQLRKSDPLYDQKCALGQRDSSFPIRRIRICVCDNENSRAALGLLRIIEADAVDMEQHFATGPIRSTRDAQIAFSVRNEIKTMQALKRICSDSLAAYPTTLQEDCQRLQTLAPFSNERHAVIQIKGEKEVLLHYNDLAETAIHLLEIKDAQEFDRALQEVRTSKHAIILQYCRNTVVNLRQEEQRKTLMNQKVLDFSLPTIL